MNVKALLQLACVAVLLFQAIVTYQPGPVVPPVVDPNVPPVVVDPDDPPPVDPTVPGTPVSFQGFRVLVLSETEPDQAQRWFDDLMASTAVDNYLDTHCDGGMSGWRNWDDDLNPQNSPTWLQEMFAVPDTGSPSVTIASRGRAYSHAVPQSEVEFLNLLKRYGGQ